jgi:(2Fe-2S) ferredoxin
VVVSNSAGSVTSGAATVTVNAVVPTITTQPANQMATVGATATFTVVANGGSSTLSYQWKNGGTAITGATGASYTTPALTLAESGSSYTVVVTDSAGSVTSNAATVTVTVVPVAPTITTQPTNQTVNAGATATFTVVATGTATLTYQWKSGGTAVTGATAASYTTPVLAVANSGTSYTVVVSNSAGSVTSNAATVTVNAVAPSITTQPTNQTVNAGATATFTVVATGTAPLTYQWKSGGTAINGATAASYTTPVLAVANSGTSYTVVVSNSAGSVTSSAATVTVNAVAPSITTQPANQTVNDGATATFTVVATGTAPLTYQWSKGGTAISGATAASYTTPALTVSNSGTSYTVMVSNSAGNMTSNPATVTVNAVTPTITTQPTNQTVEVGATAAFTVVANGGSSTLSYQWKKNGTAISGATSASYTTPATAPTDNGSSFTVVVTDSAGHVTSLAATLTVTHTLALDAGEIGGTGNVDGTGAAAEFYNPSGLAMDSSGNIYVADSTDQTIRMITPGGVVTTVAGTAYVAGYTDATGTSAQFNDPQSIAVDSSGNLYVADEGNNVIRKITMPGGTVSTFAGTGVAGYNDGAGNVAQFNSPAGIAVDKLNAVYVADESNDVIRKITTGGVVSTIAGTAGTAGSTDGAALTTALFNAPTGVAVDTNLKVYVADWLNTDIRELSAGVVSTIAGSVGNYGHAMEPVRRHSSMARSLFPSIVRLRISMSPISATVPCARSSSRLEW